MEQPSEVAPGLLVLHGNRLEWLKDAVIDWTAQQPLGALEEDVFLVQSNGIAEWLKRALADRLGVCAATRVELPARFLWRTYRAMLGNAGAPSYSPLDKSPLVWRLMRLLDDPMLLGGSLRNSSGDELEAPLRRFLQADPMGLAGASGPAQRMVRRLQLAQRLADLFDQYQVYRVDWLDAWAQGRDVLPMGPAGLAGLSGSSELPLPAEHAWQPALWRALLVDLLARNGQGPEVLRPAVHARFVAAMTSENPTPQAPQRPLPRRVVAFGMSHLPRQTLEALAALSQRCQVLLAVPNPCRYHWADIIEGRELLRSQRRRFASRGDLDLAALPLPEAHALAHPLLAAWGRQGRDFIRMLDDFDDAQAVRTRLPLLRIDLFDEADVMGTPCTVESSDSSAPLLQQVQAAVRDLLPLAEHPHAVSPTYELSPDGSIVFHLAHSSLREVEILHDQLLHRLGRAVGARKDTSPLTPREIVVMVPDIEPWAPLIHAVFGAHGPHDPRRIPYEIADLRPRGRAPLMVALEWLLSIDQQRCTASELRDLIDVPALARRFGLAEADRSLAARWLDGAGVRWGSECGAPRVAGPGQRGRAEQLGLRRAAPAGRICDRVSGE